MGNILVTPVIVLTLSTLVVTWKWLKLKHKQHGYDLVTRQEMREVAQKIKNFKEDQKEGKG